MKLRWVYNFGSPIVKYEFPSGGFMAAPQQSSSVPQPNIRDVANQVDSAEHTTPFSKENTQVIKEMMSVYGKTEDEVVLTAVTLLYMIFQRTRTAVNITVTSKERENFTFAMPSFDK
jgi:hypothetical protein